MQIIVSSRSAGCLCVGTSFPTVTVILSENHQDTVKVVIELPPCPPPRWSIPPLLRHLVLGALMKFIAMLYS